MFSCEAEAVTENDAWDIAERRARDAGYTPKGRDKIIDTGRAGNTETRLWWVRLRVTLRVSA